MKLIVFIWDFVDLLREKWKEESDMKKILIIIGVAVCAIGALTTVIVRKKH